MIKGVFFDVGGTLYSYRRMRAATGELMAMLAEKFGLSHDPAVLLGHYAAASRQVDVLHADKAAWLFRDYSEAVFLEFATRLERPDLHVHFDWYEPLQRAHLVGSLELREDCHAALDRLKSMGLYLSVVSNADDNQLAPLVERAQLRRWMNDITSSEEARSCKPDRRFFEVALRKSGLPADQVLFVGDSPEQDIAGAHAVGMRTALIVEPGSPPPMHVGKKTVEPDVRITRLGELPGVLEDWSAQRIW
jgi:HAD superfamily hydrolase (TIGR01509 family)